MRAKKETSRWCCLRVVDHRALEVGGEDVAHDADRQVGLLEDERGRLGLADALLEHLVELEQVLQLALEVRARGAVRGGADDRAAAAEVELLGLLAQAVALLVLEPARDADALAGRRVDHVAAGDGDLHREPGALGLQRVLDDLDDDLLPGRQQVGDARARRREPRPRRTCSTPGMTISSTCRNPFLSSPMSTNAASSPGRTLSTLPL